MCRRGVKSDVKITGSTRNLRLKLILLRVGEVNGIPGVAVKCASADMLSRCRYEAHQNPDNHGYYSFPFDSSMHPDSWVGARALEDIESRKSDDKNFIWVSFSGPHYPIDTPDEYTERVDLSLFEERIYKDGEWDDESKYHYRGYHGPGTTEGSGPCEGGAQKSYTEEYWSEWRRRYLGNIALIDEWIGKIINAARERFGDDLMIIFTTDHGEMMGNHSLWGKNGSLFEDVLRIPLIVHRPGQVEKKEINETVSSLEIFPTILSAAGVRDIPSCDGDTLENTVARGGRDFIISECDNRVAVIKDSLKLEINRVNMRGRTYLELYDLEKDPYEFENVYGREGYEQKTAELYALLEKERGLMQTVFYTPEDGEDYWLDPAKRARVLGGVSE